MIVLILRPVMKQGVVGASEGSVEDEWDELLDTLYDGSIGYSLF